MCILDLSTYHVYLDLFGKQRKSDSFSLRRRKIHTLHVKSMRGSALIRKITQAKPKEMLLLVGMNMKTQTKIQNQPSISFNTQIMFFQWKVLMSAPMNNRKRKILEAFFIAVKRPTLNEQKDSKKLTLFRNNVT